MDMFNIPLFLNIPKNDNFSCTCSIKLFLKWREKNFMTPMTMKKTSTALSKATFSVLSLKIESVSHPSRKNARIMNKNLMHLKGRDSTSL